MPKLFEQIKHTVDATIPDKEELTHGAHPRIDYDIIKENIFGGQKMESKKLEILRNNLEALGYNVACFDTATQAAAYINEKIDGKTVGFAGSATLTEMGLYDLLSTHNQVFWHARIPEGMSADDVRTCAAAAEVYLSSVNGVSLKGEIVNIDGNCNRVASIFYGHKKVYLVIGENKIAEDYEAALFRARNIAAPLNAKRLGVKTPCAARGDHCYDCNSPDRICRGLSVLWSKPRSCEYEIILVNEKLGF